MKTNESTFILRSFSVPEKAPHFLFICACTVNEQIPHEAKYPTAQLANDFKKIYKSVFLINFKLLESPVVNLATTNLTLKIYALLTTQCT